MTAAAVFEVTAVRAMPVTWLSLLRTVSGGALVLPGATLCLTGIV